MPALNYNKTPTAKPIAIVRGGDGDGRVLYLHNEEGASREKPTIQAVRYMNDLKDVKPTERVRVMNTLVEAHSAGKTVDELTDVPAVAKEVYKRICTDLASANTVELPDDSTFCPIPDPDPSKRQVYYVAGQSGSGKSYFARGIAENYKKLFPDRDVYLISKLQEDETLDRMKVGKPKRISLESLVEDYPDIEEFRDCLVIFDDFDTLDKKIFFPVVHKLIEDLCIMGRHTNTSMLILSHYLTNYSKTRLILGEANFLVMYPLATSAKALKYVAEHYGNMDKEDIVKLKRRGRWIMIHKNYPSYVISAHEANLLHC